jgi:hypothetical protein
MSKFYCKCGELEVVLQAENPVFAAMDAIQNHAKGGMVLTNWVFVDQRGFRMGLNAEFWVSLACVMLDISGELDEG